MTDLAKAYVQIVPSARGMKAGLTSIVNGEMPSGGKSAGSLFGSNLVSTIKGVITVVTMQHSSTAHGPRVSTPGMILHFPSTGRITS